MRVKTIAIAVGVSAPFIASAAASGDFVGLTVESKPNELGILVCNVYAVFDNTEDHLEAVYGSPEDPSFINVIGGTFYQHAFDENGFSVPNPLFFRFAPSLRYDTYFTIGVKTFNPADPGIPEGQPENNLYFSAGFPLFEESTMDLSSGVFGGGAAYSLLPDDAQGFPFNPDFVGGDGRLLIGQFSTADGVGIEGQLHFQYTSNGETGTAVATFEHTLSSCPWDCGNSDGMVGIVDMLNLLTQWFQEGGTCAFNDGPVGILDLLQLLANWGPCP